MEVRIPDSGGSTQVLKNPTPAGWSRGCVTGEVGGKGLDAVQTDRAPVCRRADRLEPADRHAANRASHRRGGNPGGSGAVITAGAPLAVRAAPGWDAAVSYEIADGSAVTVWDVAQPLPTAACGTPWTGASSPSTPSPATPRSTEMSPSTRTPRRILPRRMPPPGTGSSRQPSISPLPMPRHPTSGDRPGSQRAGERAGDDRDRTGADECRGARRSCRRC